MSNGCARQGSIGLDLFKCMFLLIYFKRFPRTGSTERILPGDEGVKFFFIWKGSGQLIGNIEEYFTRTRLSRKAAKERVQEGLSGLSKRFNGR